MTKSTTAWGLPTAALAEDVFEGTGPPVTRDLTWLSRPIDERTEPEDAPVEGEAP